MAKKKKKKKKKFKNFLIFIMIIGIIAIGGFLGVALNSMSNILRKERKK